jgi:hypothetical protein
VSSSPCCGRDTADTLTLSPLAHEVGNPVCSCHDHFTVEHELIRRERAQRVGNRLEAACPVVTRARVDGGFAHLQASLCSVSVELDLVDPARAGWRGVSKRGEARFYESGKGRRLCAGKDSILPTGPPASRASPGRLLALVVFLFVVSCALMAF